MIQNNKLGIVVPPNSSEAFANGLIKLADNVTFRKEAGNSAREYAEENFSRNQLAIEFVSFIESVCQQNQACKGFFIKSD